jgi:hypothetical protein
MYVFVCIEILHSINRALPQHIQLKALRAILTMRALTYVRALIAVLSLLQFAGKLQRYNNTAGVA